MSGQTGEFSTDQARYEVISNRDSRIIRRGLTKAEADELCDHLWRKTPWGAHAKPDLLSQAPSVLGG